MPETDSRSMDLVPAALSTSRLCLAPLTREDAADLFAIRGDQQAMAFWDWPGDASADDTARLVESVVDDMAAGRSVTWALRSRANSAFIGLFDLTPVPGRHDTADVGFMILRAAWGLGYGGEALRCLIDHARSSGAARLCARVHDGNERSVRLLQSAGFVECGVLPAYEIRPGVVRDCWSFDRRL
jgi:ribosomal-protein-alanine N-acetyltransferase